MQHEPSWLLVLLHVLCLLFNWFTVIIYHPEGSCSTQPLCRPPGQAQSCLDWLGRQPGLFPHQPLQAGPHTGGCPRCRCHVIRYIQYSARCRWQSVVLPALGLHVCVVCQGERWLGGGLLCSADLTRLQGPVCSPPDLVPTQCPAPPQDAGGVPFDRAALLQAGGNNLSDRVTFALDSKGFKALMAQVGPRVAGAARGSRQ